MQVPSVKIMFIGTTLSIITADWQDLRLSKYTPPALKALANPYSLVMTCRANDINPYYYFRHLFTELPKRKPEDDLDGLMPWNVDLGEVE